MSFFPGLPTELSLTIIDLAATPYYGGCDNDPQPHVCYATAVSLAAVSTGFRAVVIPILLNTVVLRSHEDLVTFIRFIQLQQHLKASGSRLAVDYLRVMRRFWNTESFPNFVNTASEEYLDYGLLYDVLKNMEWVGLNNSTLHLLQYALDERDVDPASDWTCRQATFWGRFWRWTPFTSNEGGLAYLRKLTHLAIWLEDQSDQPVDDPRGLHTWVKQIPFKYMPNLTHFACSLARDDIERDGCPAYHTPNKMMVYIARPQSQGPSKHIIEQWVSDPQDKHGVVVQYSPSPRSYPSLQSCEDRTFLFWEEACLRGDDDRAWAEASKIVAG
ncbi:hypothetical protein LshimejAT787_0408110 [Lyophyllum shimeji]|uniref:Uncharacterized protein n=1 Tax=Lyophyllum shimeji TaxID=47721 RepID=A0A9P3PKU0_LYOSH|nr:hypothetical protein LshimejAT787_0408110 [Lyophyllum shimeji]